MLDSYELLQAINGIHEEDVMMAGKIYFNNKSTKYIGCRRIITFGLAAVLLLSLGVTAYATGLLAPIFSSMKLDIVKPDKSSVSPEFAQVMDDYYTELEEKNSVYAAAAEYMDSAQALPETVPLPEFHNSSLILSERYYDGETLLLGINFEQLKPGLAVGYEPDAALMERMNNVAFFHDAKGNDNLDVLLSKGMQKDIYDSYLESRSDYARKHDLRHQSAITFDAMLQSELSQEEYEKAWQMLERDGQLCVMESSVFISDHILMDDGSDLGVNAQEATENGIFIEAGDLPEKAKGLDTLNIQLKVKNVLSYYYMELGGPVYYCTELVGETLVPFSIENAKQ